MLAFARTAVAACALVVGALTAQNSWFQMSVNPRPRGNTPWLRMAYDEARDQMVLLNQFDETWLWNGSAWFLATGQSRSLGNVGSGITYNTTRSAVTVVGSFGRVYEWNGNVWNELITTTPRPAIVSGGSTTFDTAGQRLVFFGGSYSSTALSNETWELDPAVNRWQRMVPNRTPSPRRYAAMAFHAASRRTVLFGGENTSGVPFGDTWLWDGNFWVQQFPSQSPPAFSRMEMTYDSFRERVVLVTPSAQTWEWDGAEWSREARTGAHPPGPGALAYDRQRDYSLLSVDQTWRYEGPNGFEPFGTGCPGSAGVPTMAPLNFDKPWINSVYDVDVTNIPLRTTATFMILGLDRDSWFGLFNLPLDLGFLGMPNCLLYVRGDFVFTFANNGGRGTFSFMIPNDPGLDGGRFFLQAVVFDPPANAFGAIVSGGAQVTMRLR